MPQALRCVYPSNIGLLQQIEKVGDNLWSCVYPSNIGLLQHEIIFKATFRRCVYPSNIGLLQQSDTSFTER